MKLYRDKQRAAEDWLGDVPKHWQKASVGSITTVVSERNRPDLPLLSVYRDFGVIERQEDDENHNVIPEDLSNYKVVRRGQLVLNKMKTWQGSLGVSDFNGIVSPAYIVCTLHGEFNPRFIHYLLRCHRYIFAWKRISYGVRCDQWDMRYADFKQVPLFIPPRNEQDAIVSFLETKERDIAAFIENKRQTIELLKEHKTALINRAVTRGLNPKVKLKPSGIPWLGDVPEHWTVRNVSTFCAVIRGASPRPAGDPKYFGGDFCPWITVAESTKDESKYLTGTTEFLTAAGVEYSRFLKSGTLILTNSGATLGVPKILAVNGCINDGSVAFDKIDERIATKDYLYYFFRMMTPVYRDRIKQGSGQPNLNTQIVKSTEVPLGPVNEQRKIVEYIEGQLEAIKSGETTCEREIALMEEYRTALISDAVTGKIDVRQ
ncbi:MAG TPA: restriction endonuclease subunit S [Planctomycetota bacterium]|nr:restriction endonuclease subunit S [Planctomycetota bacterium]